MIQRIQSIYLFLASLFGAAPFVFPFAGATAPTTEGVFADGVFNLGDNPVFMILTAAVAAIALLTIFLFNNRKLQININKLLMLLILGLLGTVAYFLFTANTTFSVGLSLFTPVLSLILVILAQRGIQADEKLVKSMDRIRD